ncbi:unnamed protein product [Meganyctiphanes norvegica]|uniref:DOMON domain-containing protein n=1 Tax=Meganyctiphanes norvegica TaxID=48144 RepID=A0AAV2PGT5_MEGNR
MNSMLYRNYHKNKIIPCQTIQNTRPLYTHKLPHRTTHNTKHLHAHTQKHWIYFNLSSLLPKCVPQRYLVLLLYLMLTPHMSSQGTSPIVDHQVQQGHDRWQHEVVLDPEGTFRVQWTPLEDHIIFRVTAKTRGYIGLGLGDSPTMDGADIIVGWVHSGRAYLQEREGHGHQEPQVDIQQDWLLVAGFQNDTHTVLIMSRPYKTCDDTDYVISRNTVHMLWAFHPDDPVNPEAAHPKLHYHGWRRGSTALYLMERGESTIPKSVLPAYVHGAGHNPSFRRPETQSWVMQNDKVEVSGVSDSLFWCNIFRRPDIKLKHHIVRYEPVIASAVKPFIQHMMVYECWSGSVDYDKEALEAMVDQDGQVCSKIGGQSATASCNHIMLAWTRGSKGLTFPAEAGYPLTPDGPRFYMLEVHYNSQGHNFWDSSGINIIYTSELRMKDAGLLSVGVAPNWKQLIPPLQPHIFSEGHCVSECTQNALPPQGIHVFGAMHSTHLLGTSVRVRHIRHGEELPSVTQDTNHNPQYQDYRAIHNPRKILPGDHLITECSYSSRNRTLITIGGVKSQDETCLSFLFYWPKLDLSLCQSNPSLSTVLSSLGIEELVPNSNPITISRPIELSGKTLAWRLQNYNWEDHFQHFQNATSEGTFNPSCSNRGQPIISDLESHDYSYPNISIPWIEKYSCSSQQKINHRNINNQRYMKDDENNDQYAHKPISVIDVDMYRKKERNNMFNRDMKQFEEDMKQVELDLEEEVRKKYPDYFLKRDNLLSSSSAISVNIKSLMNCSFNTMLLLLLSLLLFRHSI